MTVMEPQFKTGDLVRVQALSGGADDPFKDVIARDGIKGLYEVSAVLPGPPGFSQYRIKRGDGTPERVVRESQLIAAVRAGPVRH
jgi:hypothetical protein